MTDFLPVFGFALASALMTYLIRIVALQSGMMDIPNERSSHTIATPRGGGISIALCFVAYLFFLRSQHGLTDSLLMAATVGGGLVGLIGLIDDRNHVPAKYRLLVHILAAALAVYLLGKVAPIQFGDTVLELGTISYVVATVLIVWMINLFNFMDGIDGIAGAEGLFIAASASIICALTLEIGGEDARQMHLVFAGLGAACAGFLVLNWPPAKIFMGDVGSGFVGFTIGLLAVASAAYEVLPIWTSLILAGVFIVDATVTLIVRMLSGAAWYEAHRSHAYQRASRRVGSHRAVTIGVTIINSLWLFPLAVFSAMYPPNGWWLTIIAWMPLAALCWSFGAGRSEES